MRAVIGVANVVRGVGKTTTAVSLAAELALRGFETLLIDADPQAEATAYLVDPEGVRFSVADLVVTPDSRRHAHAEEMCFGLDDVLVPTAIPHLLLAPSSIRLAAAEGDIPLSLTSLRSQLSALKRRCDFAVIDTPSSLGPIAAACHFASTHLLVPVAARTPWVRGLCHMVESLGNMPCGRGRVKLLGIVCNMFDCRSHASGEFYEALKREWGDKVLRNIIHREVLIEASTHRRRPVQTYAPTSTAATLYAELTDELMTRLGAPAPAGAPVA